jgi:hypothetical protein
MFKTLNIYSETSYSHFDQKISNSSSSIKEKNKEKIH